MATNRSSAKSHQIRSKRKWETTTDLQPHCYSNQHESQWKDGTRKDVTCYSCGHQGHFSRQCARWNASFTAALGSSDGSQAEIVVSEDKSLEPFNSYHQQNVENRYLQDKMNGIITCMICGKEGHYTCECPMKDQEDKVICTLCSKEGHCCLWCCQQNKSENRACTRCGEIGHSASRHGLNCSSCDEYHPHGGCRMSKVTCLICEGQDHCLSQCPLNSVLTAVFQHQRDNFRAAVRLALSNECSTLAAAKPSEESEICEPSTAKKSAGKKPMSSVKCFNCGVEGHWAKGCPSKPQVPTPNKSNPFIMIDNTPTRVLKTICFNCCEEGHYANKCPQKSRAALRLALSKDCNTISKPVNPSKDLKERDPSTAKQSSETKLISSHGCFSCGEEGHWARSCLSKQQVLTPNKSSPLVTADRALTRVLICFNCHEEGHYSNQCPQKRQTREKCQDCCTKSSR